jgi:hypothetical protein
MNEENLKEELPEKGCQKCGHKIGGKPYYIVSLDCLYDGESISACETYALCSHCNDEIRHWLNLRAIQE